MLVLECGARPSASKDGITLLTALSALSGCVDYGRRPVRYERHYYR